MRSVREMKLNIGDVVRCRWLGNNDAIVYHVTRRCAFIYSATAASEGKGHSGSPSVVQNMGGNFGHWNLWFSGDEVVEIVRRKLVFKGNS